MKTARYILEQFGAHLKTGRPQHYTNVIVLPVTAPVYDEVFFITSDEAFELGCLEINEVSESGSVPYLKAVNSCKVKVFLAEGEEIKGAKQNRTLNTSILLEENSQTVIPVSCTEQGRWRYHKRNFAPTESWVPSGLRRMKNRSVTNNLVQARHYKSNQAEVWNNVERYMRNFRHRSATSALRDVIRTKKEDLQHLASHFPLVDNQVGVVVFVNGKLKGMDVITRPSVYARLHEKILKSYLVDALLEIGLKSKASLFDLGMEFRFDPSVAEEKFRRFMDLALMSKKFESLSPGLGLDVRMESTHVSGFALLFPDKVLHMVLFRNDAEDELNA